jgi:hypothetical protein
MTEQQKHSTSPAMMPEPEFKDAWLDAVAREITRRLNQAIEKARNNERP